MKLTREIIQKVVNKVISESTDKVPSTTKAKEVEADEVGDQLEKKVNALKAYKIQEQRLVKQLAEVRKQKAKLIASFLG